LPPPLQLGIRSRSETGRARFKNFRCERCCRFYISHYCLAGYRYESVRQSGSNGFIMKHSNSSSIGKSAQLALIVLAAGIIPAPATSADDADAVAAISGTLEVRITGFKSEQGRLAIALFANAEDYAIQENAVRRAWLDIANGVSIWRVQDLPEGEYALIAYQDENGNEQIDMRVFGMPKEPVGVSNNARGRFGPPSFKAARFQFEAPLTRHELKLR
jgi:uncharacterized protein (DUF2141 family)